ncbi:exonuclease subunit SbcC [Crocosphaera sp. UHCC 0190]|uniref:exonuclease subunit SbcC n=1 Tax=Crocosphaera sp. UHCC 0190 TaxID=3110246 RepID=UPI002B2056DF|nr:exonuclease subunit SbcC [Crocosphaera sp. UHCC 0190]MEA5511562.1 exonuclease subunit SbcC [Crocosphaera sp. UHCC 0190]
MIPLQLSLKNFLSYRDAILDFRGLHTACICGANGAGKSSLLEAITWVIWGKSRAVTEEDIIHTGVDYVRVDFEFISNQQIYRIIRSRQRGKSNSSLDFQIESAGDFLSLTAKGIRATQEKIISTLKLDYDTFINSAYLRQGRADEFMLRPPTQRKQILADLLKLEQYEELASKAKDLSKQYKGQSEQIEINLSGIKQQISQEKEIEKQQKILVKELESLQILQAEERQKLQLLQQEESQRKTWEEQLGWQQNKQRSLQQDEKRLTQEKLELTNQWTKQKQFLDQEGEINHKYQELLQFQREEESLSQQFQLYQDLQQKRQELEQDILRQNNQLQLQIRQIQTRLEHLAEQEKDLQQILNRSEEVQSALKKLYHHRQRLQQLDQLQHKVTPLLKQKQTLETELEKIKANLTAKLEQLEILEKQYLEELKKIPAKRELAINIDTKIQEIDKKKVYQKRVQEKTQERQVLQERLKVNQRSYEEKIEELQQKLNLLEIPESACPLCEQELDEHHRHHVIGKTHKQQQEIQDQIWLLREQMSVSKREIQSLQIEYQQLEKEVKSSVRLQQEFGQIEAQLDQAGEVKIKLRKVQQEKGKIEKFITLETYGLELQSELKIITQKSQQLNYDEQTHGLTRGEVERWRWAEIKQAKIEEAIRNQGIINQQKPRLIKQLSQLQTQLKQLDSDSEVRQKINQVEQALQELGYDRSHHQKLSNYIRQSQCLVISYQKLQEAKQQYPKLQEQLNIIENRLQTNRKYQGKIQQEIKQLSENFEKIKDNRQEIITLEKKIQTQRQNLDELLAQKGRLEQSLSQLDTLKQQSQEQTQQLKEVRKQYRIYQELTKAFGKNGIQALMIENVLPQLEAETNQVLSRLTGNQLHIQFITQRAGKGSNSRQKSAKLIDTLDIIIADVKGTRAYETYSGGEAFRINFSVRLALAKLLAQRAGTSLQMLIIDEGFGTQDTEGCERLVAAINAIAADFSCILAVTHMPQFKEAFQHRIEVYKTNQGSQLSLVS